MRATAAVNMAAEIAALAAIQSLSLEPALTAAMLNASPIPPNSPRKTMFATVIAPVIRSRFLATSFRGTKLSSTRDGGNKVTSMRSELTINAR
jgi:hypothetical protein